MRLISLLLAGTLATALTTLPSQAARAETRVTLTPAAGLAGNVTTVRGRGFRKEAPVTVRLAGKAVARLTTSLRGSFSASFTISDHVGKPLRVLSTSRGLRVTNFFRVAGSPTEPQAGEVAFRSGTRLRWAPQSGYVGGTVGLRGTHFPKRRRVRMKLGPLGLAAGHSKGKGDYSKRIKIPSLGSGRHRVRLSAGGRSIRFSFTIAKDPLVVAAGDIACVPESPSFNGGVGTVDQCHMRQTADLTAMLNPAAVLGLGNLQNEAGTLADFMTSYEPTWGRFKLITRPVPGNHEYGTPAATGYFTSWGSLAGRPGKGYYSFNLGNWHLIALNSNCSEPGIRCRIGFAQEQWLRADLAAHRNRCVLAFWHHAIFGSGQEGNHPTMRDIFQDLYDARADLVLVAHDHDYERFAPQNADGGLDLENGIPEIVVGTGGRDLMRFKPTIKPNSQVRNADTFGVLAVRLHPDSYDWQFVPEAGRTFRDSGTQSCH
jgi:hypothetical protein